jgi:outer membrane protein assembly factor BamB
LRGAPLLTADALYVVSKAGFLHTLTLAGEQRWSQALGAAARRSPVAAGGYIIAGTQTGELIACRADGSIAWHYQTDAPGVGELTTVGDVLYVGDALGRIHAVDAASGRALWRTKTAMHISAAPARWNALVFVGNHAGWLHAFDAQRGQSVWERDVSGGERTRIKALVGVGAALFAGLEAGRVVKVEGSRGRPEKAWRFTPAGSRLTALVADLSSRRLYVASDAGLQAVDAQTGAEQWRFTAGGRVVAAPAIAAGLCYIACAGGLYVLEAAGGAPAWRIPLSEPAAGLAFGAGVLAVVGREGTLAAHPWHGGQWTWAAEFSAEQGLPEHAAAFHVLAGDSAPPAARCEHYGEALAFWHDSHDPERAPRLMDAAPYLYAPGERAEAYCDAAAALAGRERAQAAELYHHAADIYDEIGQAEPAQKCRELASQLAALPRLRVRLINAPPCEAGERIQIVFEVRNFGDAPTAGPVNVRLGGHLAQWVKFELSALPASGRQEVVAEEVVLLGPQFRVDLTCIGNGGVRLDESKTFTLDVKRVDADILVGGDAGALILRLEEGAPLPKVRVRGDVGMLKVERIPKVEPEASAPPFAWPELPPGILGDERELATLCEVKDALEVNVGYSAIMLADGRSLGCFGPGRYTRADFPELRKPLVGRAPRWQAVRVLLTPFRLGFRCGPYLTADGAQVGVALAADVSIQPERDLTFWRGSGVPVAPLTTLQLAERLEPTVSNIIETRLREQSTAELLPSQKARELLSQALEMQLRGQWERVGVHLEEVTAIRFVPAVETSC